MPAWATSRTMVHLGMPVFRCYLPVKLSVTQMMQHLPRTISNKALTHGIDGTQDRSNDPQVYSFVGRIQTTGRCWIASISSGSGDRVTANFHNRPTLRMW